MTNKKDDVLNDNEQIFKLNKDGLINLLMWMNSNLDFTRCDINVLILKLKDIRMPELPKELLDKVAQGFDNFRKATDLIKAIYSPVFEEVFNKK